MEKSYVKVFERHGYYRVNIRLEKGETLVFDFGKIKYSVQYNGYVERYLLTKRLNKRIVSSVVRDLSVKYLKKQKPKHLERMLEEALNKVE